MEWPECAIPRLAINAVSFSTYGVAYASTSHQVTFVRAINKLTCFNNDISLRWWTFAVLHYDTFNDITVFLYFQKTMVIDDMHSSLINILLIDSQSHLRFKSKLHGASAIVLTNAAVKIIDIRVTYVGSTQASCGKPSYSVCRLDQQHSFSFLASCISRHHTRRCSTIYTDIYLLSCFHANDKRYQQ